MKTFGETLRELRESEELLLRQVAADMEMDMAILSKYERGDRKPNREQVVAFAKYYKVKPKDLLIPWLSDKIVYELEDEDDAMKVLQVAEEKIKYQTKNKNRK